MLSKKYMMLLVVITMACAAHPSILMGKTKGAEETSFCGGSLSQKLGSPECGALLRICIEGVVYKTSAMAKQG